MREIKFRGKSGTQWRYGDLYHNERGEVMIYETKTSGRTLDGVPFDGWRIVVDSETVGQYTGAKDINRNRAYEGDIIKFYDDRGHELVGVIKWNTLACRWYVDCSVRDCPYHVFDARYAFEIIGNVHDNPKLLERKP